MAIVIKRKSSSASEAGLSDRQQETLASIGLGSLVGKTEPKPVPKEKRLYPVNVQEGARVRITNDLYPWVKKWNVGDTAIVIRYHTAPKEFKSDPRYACLVVKLDKPRDGGDGIAYLHAWETELMEKSSDL